MTHATVADHAPNPTSCEDTLVKSGVQWTDPDGFPPLLTGQTQLWRIDLADEDAVQLLDAAYGLLNDEERTKAARMRAGHPRDEFVAGRGALRALLGSALGCHGRELSFVTGEHGKPSLTVNGPAFNVAHSHGLVVVALADLERIGVDVEWMDQTVEIVDVAQTAFHPDDAARVAAAPPGEGQLAEFYRIWTCREAVGKADGRGITGSLDDLLVGGAHQLSFTAKVGNVHLIKTRREQGAEVFAVSVIEDGEGYLYAVARSVSKEMELDFFRLNSQILRDSGR